MPSESGTKIKALSYSLITLALIFIVSEGVLRILGVNPKVDNPFFMLVRVYEYPDYFKKDHNLFWRLRPDIKEGTEFLVPGSYRTNSVGLRGAEMQIDTENRQRRVACFGNSCTFGWRLQESETYEQQLESLLNHETTGGAYQVFNCGVPGYSSFQGLRMLQEYQPLLKPDIVTICYGWNDHWAAGFDIEDKNQRIPPQFVLDLQNALSTSHVYRTIKYILLSKYEKKKEYTFDRQAPRYRVSLQDYAENLRGMINYCLQRKIKPVIITTPSGMIFSDSEAAMQRFHNTYNQTTIAVATEMNVSYVDAASLFQSHPEFYDDPKGDFIHYNRLGAKLIAEKLAEIIRK